jgi:hypothetical protein
MKLSFGEKQPYRIWFDYLKTCLNDESLSQKVDRKFYKDWNLTSVKTQKFDTWLKTHEHLFTDTSTTMKISNGTKSSNSILLEVPLNYSITKVQREVGKVLGNKLNKRLSKFAITSNRHLILPPLDYFLYAYKTKRDNPKNLTLEDIWGKVNEHIKKRQNKFVGKISIKKLVEQGKLRGRFLMGQSPYDKNARNKAVIINRNIKKAKRILDNVCKGVFTGNYSLE